MNYSSQYFKTQTIKALQAICKNDGPFLIHCTEGKDRTGFVCILIEALAGASYQQIVDDYVYAEDGRSHAYVCHRLDQYTSGILIFAKNSYVQQLFRDSWSTYVVERMYMAIVEGCPQKLEGEVRSYLAENSAMKVYSTDNPEEGKLSVTRYKVIKTVGDYSQVDIQLLTGRKNQIRVHMSDLGCPIAGDKKYGAQSNPCGRLMLHNYALQFYHPITRENLRFELPLPAVFKI